MSRMLLSTTSLGGLVTWKPTYSHQPKTLEVPSPYRVVPIQWLEPDGIVPIQWLEPDGIVSIQSLEPDGIVPIESLLAAPVISISALAPDVLMAVA